jgi:hypothetical protein
MQQHGWTLLFHDNLIEQMMKLRAMVLRAQENDPRASRPTPTSSSSGPWSS